MININLLCIQACPQVPRAQSQHHHRPLTSRRAQPDCLCIRIMSSPLSLFLAASLAASRAFAAPQDGQFPLGPKLPLIADSGANSAVRRLVLRPHSSGIDPR